jgi:hypothetical protein
LQRKTNVILIAQPFVAFSYCIQRCSPGYVTGFHKNAAIQQMELLFEHFRQGTQKNGIDNATALMHK